MMTGLERRQDPWRSRSGQLIARDQIDEDGTRKPIQVMPTPINRVGLIDHRALQRAILVGTFLQVVSVLIAHFSAWIETHALLFGGMMISATMGYLYAQEVARGYAKGAYGGAIAGGLCALIGIAVSVILGDMTPKMLLVRALISVLTGAVGGIYGQMAVDWTRGE